MLNDETKVASLVMSDVEHEALDEIFSVMEKDVVCVANVICHASEGSPNPEKE